MKPCITCPRCGAQIETVVLLCPRCREPLPLGCDGDCKECATKGGASAPAVSPPAISANGGGS